VSKREIVKSLRFEASLLRLFSSVQRGDAALIGLEWTLHRIAAHGNAVRGTTLLCWPIHPDDGRLYIVYYSVEDHRVILQDLRRRDPLPPDFMD
jgi:hypothetical protein